MLVFAGVLVVAAAATAQCLDVLDMGATYFLEELELTQQASLLLLLFCILFGSISFAVQSLVSSSGTSSYTTKKIDYPLAEIAAATTEKEKFKAVFPLIKAQIVTRLQETNELLPEASSWIDRMMQYSVPGGKLNRGTTVVSVYQVLKGRTLTDTEVAQASVLGWTIEFLQAFFLVADDVMDASETRRGQPCWYKLPEIGLIAINDAFLLESFVFQILKQHFGNHPAYPDLLQLLLDITQKTEIGQLYDLTSQTPGVVDLDRFTMDRYRNIVKYKTAYYSFYLPVAMGMRLAGITENSAYSLAETICVKMGEYFQIQDDYLDCFGDPSVIGKVGTDIQDNKCSWLVVQALERASHVQRKTLQQNYGQHDAKKVQRIKDLYKNLDLERIFEEYEESSYASIQEDLKQVTLMPRDVFELFLKKIYKRAK